MILMNGMVRKTMQSEVKNLDVLKSVLEADRQP
jgi:hypothetical protein